MVCIAISGAPPQFAHSLLCATNSLRRHLSQVLQLLLDNPFPLALLKVGSPVRCLDLSVDRKRLAVVDEKGTCLVYHLTSKQLLFQVRKPATQWGDFFLLGSLYTFPRNTTCSRHFVGY